VGEALLQAVGRANFFTQVAIYAFCSINSRVNKASLIFHKMNGSRFADIETG
jgi:hypothetical protein